MKVVMICPPGEGHYSVFFPLAHQYKKKGAEVIFLILADGETRCADACISYHIYGEKILPKRKLNELVSIRGKEKGLKAMKLMAEELRLMEEALLNCASKKLELLQPDLVIGDQVYLSISTLAEHIKCRCHIISTTLPFQTHIGVPPIISGRMIKNSLVAYTLNMFENHLFNLFTNPIIKMINEYRSKWKLKSVKSANSCYDIAEKCYSHCPSSFNYPNMDTLLNIEYLPIMTQKNFRRNHFETWKDKLVIGKHLIYISLGTMQNNDEKIFINILEAIDFATQQVVLSTGGNESLVEILISQYPQAIVKSFVPQLEVLTLADVFVTHAGMNSIIEAIITETPVLALPVMGDQKAIAARVVYQDIGIKLDIKNSALIKIKLAIKHLLVDKRFKKNIHRIKIESSM